MRNANQRRNDKSAVRLYESAPCGKVTHHVRNPLVPRQRDERTTFTIFILFVGGFLMQAKSSVFPVRSLAELEEVAISFRMLWQAVPGGFNTAGWKWIKDAFYSASIKHEYWRLSEKRKRLVDELLIDVETILDDDSNDDGEDESGNCNPLPPMFPSVFVPPSDDDGKGNPEMPKAAGVLFLAM